MCICSPGSHDALSRARRTRPTDLGGMLDFVVYGGAPARPTPAAWPTPWHAGRWMRAAHLRTPALRARYTTSIDVTGPTSRAHTRRRPANRYRDDLAGRRNEPKDVRPAPFGPSVPRLTANVLIGRRSTKAEGQGLVPPGMGVLWGTNCRECPRLTCGAFRPNKLARCSLHGGALLPAAVDAGRSLLGSDNQPPRRRRNRSAPEAVAGGSGDPASAFDQAVNSGRVRSRHGRGAGGRARSHGGGGPADPQTSEGKRSHDGPSA